VPVPEILGPVIAPALFGLSADEARTELLRAVRGPTPPGREPPFPGLTIGDTHAVAEQRGPRLPGVLPSIWGAVPLRNVAFTGRDAMVIRLREGLCSGSRSVVQALHGMGGVGKTQLATEYAWRFANEYDAVWWVTAEQTDLIGEQLANFAVAWKLAKPGTLIEPAVQALFTHLRGQGRWLVVFDNAPNQAAVRAWLPAGPGHVIMTSRDPHWSEIATRIEVDVFARDESITLLRTQVATLSDTDADRLANAVGDLPLAVAQAAGLIAETGMPPSEYLQLLRDSTTEVLSEGKPDAYPLPLAAAVRVSLDQLTSENPAAGQLLTVCAFLAPEPVPTWLFTTAPAGVLPEPLATVTTSTLAFRRCLGRIGRYGLARIAHDQLQLHRLTQAIVRDAQLPEQCTHHTATVVALLSGMDPGDPADPVTWPGWAQLIPHLRAADLASTDNHALRDHTCQAVWYLLRRGDTHTAHRLAQQLYQAWTTRRGSDHHTLTVASHLADAWAGMGHYQQAHDLTREIYDRSRQILGPDHPATLAAANNLAIYLRRLGQVQAARNLNKDTLDRKQRVLGPDHPNTLRSAASLALDLSALGQHQAAHTLHEDTFNRFERVLGPDHPDTLRAAQALANNLSALGYHQAAHTLNDDTFTRQQRVLGHNHPDTLYSAKALANNLHALGQHEAVRPSETGARTDRGRPLPE